MTSADDEPPLKNTWAHAARVLHHASQIDPCELAILHALQEVRAQFKFPRPPFRPRSRRQTASVCSGGSAVLPDACASARRLIIAPAGVGYKST